MLMKKLIVVATVLVLGGCSREPVSSYRVEKEQPAGHAGHEGHGHAGHAGHDHGAASAELAWNAPQGWKTAPSSGMRRASYLIGAGRDQTELSVIALEGGAGGELANLNRWRSQLGLEPIGPEELDSSVKTIKSPAGSVRVFRLAGAEAAMAAAKIELEGSTWFFKLSGGPRGVDAAWPQFEGFLRSLRRAG